MPLAAIGTAVAGSLITNAILGGGGGVGNTGAAAAAADPFAGQREQYQAQLQKFMSGAGGDITTQPYHQQLQQMMTGGFTPQDPSYAWRFGQGQQALERSLAAKHMGVSGGAMTAATEYGQNLGATEYANQFTRLMGGAQLESSDIQNLYARLARLSGADVGSPSSAGQIMQQGNLAQQQAAGAFGAAVAKPLVSGVSDWWGSTGGSPNFGTAVPSSTATSGQLATPDMTGFTWG